MDTHQEKMNLNLSIYNHINTLKILPNFNKKRTIEFNDNSQINIKPTNSFIDTAVHTPIDNETNNDSENKNKFDYQKFSCKTQSRLNLIHNEKDLNYENKNLNIFDKLFHNNVSLQEKEFQKFLIIPLEKSNWMKCKIERKIIDKQLTKFFLSLSDNDKILLSCIKRPKKSYLIYATIDNLYEDNNYLGKVKSNFFGTEFNLYDNGKKPKKEKNSELHRINLATITYETNLFGLKGPRKMKIYIPKLIKNENEIKKLNINQNDTLKKNYSTQKENHKVTLLMNKQPNWSEKRKCFILDYKDRSIKQSVKNFQVVQSSYLNSEMALNNEILLQFGRVGDNSYILDFQTPFSPLLAFSIALSSIDNKIACE